MAAWRHGGAVCGLLIRQSLAVTFQVRGEARRPRPTLPAFSRISRISRISALLALPTLDDADFEAGPIDLHRLQGLEGHGRTDVLCFHASKRKTRKGSVSKA